MVDSFPGSMDDEKAVHKLFDEFRIRGEWFRDDISITKFVGRLNENREFLNTRRTTIRDIIAGIPTGAEVDATFPQDPGEFERWFNTKFVKIWDGPMQAIAARAYYALRGDRGYGQECIEAFSGAYRGWLISR